MTLAHVGGVPLEELAPLALAGGSLAVAALRWHAAVVLHRLRRRARG